MHIDRRLYFESLKSQRRLDLLRHLDQLVRNTVAREIRTNDPFLSIPSLDNYDIYAGDGHYLTHATHDHKIDDKYYATGHLFSLNLRNQTLSHLTLADHPEMIKLEHDMHALKRLSVDQLRNSSAPNKKIIMIWDRAGIDATYWQRVLLPNGIFMVSRAKENMKLRTIGHLPYDKKSLNNRNVRGFELVEVNGQALRCIYYTCPESGAKYTFITSVINVEPGVIAALYKARWNIEKTFDETKRKLAECKSWATSSTAKNIQALFICMTHNLLVHLQHRILETNTTSTADARKRAQRQKVAIQKAAKRKRKHAPLLLLFYQRCSHITMTFIRWVRHHLYIRRSWKNLVLDAQIALSKN